ncbi:putative GPI-anchored wall transfer protein [Ordospora pajunii]|uniref:putative GPI-anchored wall transfer protein n=1 Tax=Ordospora pajunii TaxID=3039483 RepID=UPI0029528912|nr:putative GPI-anchored wall transfer protein [Ordospora pajunii]KAH9412287.1 putative GPI-anchored wall transfer protein [Ordospora pajunii]
MRIENELELLQLTGLSVFSLLVYSTGYQKTLLNDFVFCIVPQYLAIMYPDSVGNIYICLAMMISYSGIENKTSRNDPQTRVIDMMRFVVSLLVVIAIYAADFSMFDPRLGKFHFFGIGLMDIGVGSFIFNGGIIGYKSQSRRYFKSCPVLLVLGLTRYFVVEQFGLNVNPREYGMHLNFYFLLAFVNVMYAIVRSRHDFVVGLCMITVYEVVLKCTGLTHFLLSDRRETLLEKNKEGVLAIIPYLSIFLMATAVGKICFSDMKRYRKGFGMLGITAIFGCLYVVFSVMNEASRRLGNGAFVFWVLGLHSLHMTVYLLFESMFDLHVPLMMRFSSSNMMFVFLFSNLLVLAGNMMFELKAFSALESHANMLVYLVSVFVIPAVFASTFDLRRIGLKYRA